MQYKQSTCLELSLIVIFGIFKVGELSHSRYNILVYTTEVLLRHIVHDKEKRIHLMKNYER